MPEVLIRDIPIAKAVRVQRDGQRQNLVFGWANMPERPTGVAKGVALMGSLEEKRDAVCDAFCETFPGNPNTGEWNRVMAIFDDHLIAEMETMSPSVGRAATEYYRFDYTIDEDGDVIINQQAQPVALTYVAKALEDAPTARAPRRSAVVKIEDGGAQYPASAYAFVPDATDPDTWELRTRGLDGDALDELTKGLGDWAKEKASEASEAVRSATDKVTGRIRGAYKRVQARNPFKVIPDTLKKSGPKVDLQGDILPLEELEKAAYEFVVTSRAADVLHNEQAVGTLVESFLVTPEKLMSMGFAEEVAKSAAGGWWVGFRVDDPTMDRVESGDLAMFSIGGRAVRTLV